VIIADGCSKVDTVSDNDDSGMQRGEARPILLLIDEADGQRPDPVIVSLRDAIRVVDDDLKVYLSILACTLSVRHIDQ